MKYIYFEDQEGGMGVHRIKGATIEKLTAKLDFIYGWMSGRCKKEDEQLVLDMINMEVGECLDHRLGILVRVKG